jgi:hypothetical protein
MRFTAQTTARCSSRWCAKGFWRLLYAALQHPMIVPGCFGGKEVEPQRAKMHIKILTNSITALYKLSLNFGALRFHLLSRMIFLDH